MKSQHSKLGLTGAEDDALHAKLPPEKLSCYINVAHVRCTGIVSESLIGYTICTLQSKSKSEMSNCCLGKEDWFHNSYSILKYILDDSENKSKKTKQKNTSRRNNGRIKNQNQNTTFSEYGRPF